MIEMFENWIDINFEAAHRLSKYNGRLKNIHGHSFHASFAIKAKSLGRTKETPDGMGIDPQKLENEVYEKIISFFDNALILAWDDKIGNLLSNNGLKIVFLPHDMHDPTCENLAKFFYNKFIDAGFEEKYQIQLEYATVRSTGTCSGPTCYTNYMRTQVVR